MLKALRHLAPALITAGLVMMLAGGGGGGVVPASDPAPGERYPIEYLDPVESKFAELHQQLRQYIVCEETGRWDEWPCDQFTPPTQAPR